MKMLTREIIKNKKVVMFDLDGTLIDSIGLWNDLDSLTLQKFANLKIDGHILQQQREKIVNNPQNNDVYQAHRQFLIDYYHLPVDLDTLTQYRRAMTRELITHQITYKPGAVAVLRALQQEGIILVLATTTSQKMLQQYNDENPNIVCQGKFTDIFDLILTTDDVSEKKPSPQIYLQAMQKLKVSPENCLVIEDSLAGVMAGKAAGIDVIAIYDQYAAADQFEITRLSDYQIKNWDEFLALF